MDRSGHVAHTRLFPICVILAPAMRVLFAMAFLGDRQCFWILLRACQLLLLQHGSTLHWVRSTALHNRLADRVPWTNILDDALSNR